MCVQIHHSPFIINHSLFTIHHSPFTIHHYSVNLYLIYCFLYLGSSIGISWTLCEKSHWVNLWFFNIYLHSFEIQRLILKNLNRITEPPMTGYNWPLAQTSKHWLWSQLEPYHVWTASHIWTTSRHVSNSLILASERQKAFFNFYFDSLESFNHKRIFFLHKIFYFLTVNKIIIFFFQFRIQGNTLPFVNLSENLIEETNWQKSFALFVTHNWKIQ